LSKPGNLSSRINLTLSDRSTGITTSVVERIEQNLKKDVIRELHKMDGKLLLHDEMETEPGTFEIVPQWEEITDEDILTPREVFDMVAKEGYKVEPTACSTQCRH